MLSLKFSLLYVEDVFLVLATAETENTHKQNGTEKHIFFLTIKMQDINRTE